MLVFLVTSGVDNPLLVTGTAMFCAVYLARFIEALLDVYPDD